MTALPLRIPYASSAASVQVRHLTELAPTESLFGRWSRHCWQSHTCLDELKRLFAPHGILRGVLAPPRMLLPVDRCEDGTLRTARDGHQRAAQILGVGLAELSLANGSFLAESLVWPAVMSDRLRACWQCLRLGFHSALYQHWAIRRCPIHGTELTTRCPECRAESRPSFASVAQAPFACSGCGMLWLRSVELATGAGDLKAVGMMLTDRLRDIAPVAVQGGNTVRIGCADAAPLLAEARTLPQAVKCRQVARWTVWSEAKGPRWPRFEERRILLSDWCVDAADRWPQCGPATARAGTETLRLLSQLCLEHQQDSLLLRTRLSLAPRGMRLSGAVSVAAAALHQTMCRYGTSRGATGEDADAAQHSLGVYDDIKWNGLQAGSRLVCSDLGNAELLTAEILGWFAICVVDASSLYALQKVDWLVEHPGTTYLAAWIVTGMPADMALHIRPRATIGSVQRLLRHYPPRVSLRENSDWCLCSMSRCHVPAPRTW